MSEFVRRWNDEGRFVLTEVENRREVLCRRMREHGFVKDGCDGRTVICGWCDNTMRQMDNPPEVKKGQA